MGPAVRSSRNRVARELIDARAFTSYPLPERILKYTKTRCQEHYLVRWRTTLVSSTELQLYTQANRPVTDDIFQLRPLLSHLSEAFIPVASPFTPEAPYYLVQWKDTWLTPSEFSSHPDLVIDFWMRPYSAMKRSVRTILRHTTLMRNA